MGTVFYIYAIDLKKPEREEKQVSNRCKAMKTHSMTLKV